MNLPNRLPGVSLEDITSYKDVRGSLVELFRNDELSITPVMGYMSYTEPGIARGPHEHKYQTDVFIFFEGLIELRLWDNRPGANPNDLNMFLVGTHYPVRVVVPPGVVHGYRNLGTDPVIILNFPDKLYKGEGKLEEVDEIRYESRNDTIFYM